MRLNSGAWVPAQTSADVIWLWTVLCGFCLYSINAYDRHNAAYTTGVKNMQLKIFFLSHFVCYRNNVVCLKCMPSEQNAVWNGTNLYDSILIQNNVNQMSLVHGWTSNRHFSKFVPLKVSIWSEIQRKNESISHVYFHFTPSFNLIYTNLYSIL